MKPLLDRDQQLLTVNVPGDLVSTNAEILRRALHEILDTEIPSPPWRRLRLELAGAKMVDSMGLNLIVTILRAVQKTGGRMQITFSSPNVHRTFQFTRLDQHVELIKV